MNGQYRYNPFSKSTYVTKSWMVDRSLYRKYFPFFMISYDSLQPHLQHVVVIVLDPHLPEALQGQHAADAHLMEHLLHYVWEGTGSEPSLPVHRHSQQAGDTHVMLVYQIRQGLQHALLG